MTEFELKPRRGLRVVHVRELDRAAIEDFGIPSLVLMENAGQGAFERAQADLIERSCRQLLVCVGKGNNAGDGLVLARHAANAGWPVHVLLTAAVDDFSPDAALNYEVIRRMGLKVSVGHQLDPTAFLTRVPRTTMVIDALLGSGITGAAREPIASWIAAINASQLPVIALDIPSGLDADSGAAEGEVIQAGLCLSFAVAKIGLLRGAGRSCCGRLEIVPISIPRRLIDEALARDGIDI